MKGVVETIAGLEGQLNWLVGQNDISVLKITLRINARTHFVNTLKMNHVDTVSSRRMEDKSNECTAVTVLHIQQNHYTI